MSLIQEALRRQQAEQETGNTAAENTPPIPPPAADPPEPSDSISEDKPAPRKLTMASRSAAAKIQLPEEPTMTEPEEPDHAETLLEEEPEPVVDTGTEDDADNPEDEETTLVRTSSERKQHVLVPLLGILLLIVLLAGVVAWAVRLGMRMLSSEEDGPAPAAHATAAGPGATAEPAAIPPPAPSTPVIPRTDAETLGAKSSMTDTATTPPLATTTKDLATPAEKPVVPAPASPPPQPPVIWPDIHVSGIIGDGRSGSAIINGKLFGLNETVGGAVVREFGRGYVTLEYMGETRQFSVGRPLL